MTKSSSTARGILLMIAGMACFASMSIAIRMLSPLLPSAQMVLMRNLIGLGLIVLIQWWENGLNRNTLHTRRPMAHLWRSLFGFAAMESWFYSLSILPVTVATALSFTTPIFVTIFAILVLGEKAGVRRWLAILAGFVGVLVILRPGGGVLQVSASIVLLASALMALASITVKSLTRTEKPEVIVFYMALFMTPLSAPFGLMVWQPTTGYEWALAFLVALFSTTAQLLVTRAYLHADMVTLMPFDFTRLIFVSLIAYFAFGEVLDAAGWIGATIIIGAAAYITWREAKLKKSKPLAELV